MNNCEKDVERFISTVCGSFKTFEDSTDYVTRLYNEDANKLLIGDTIKGKLRELKNHQNLIIYFAGHGKDHEKEEVSYLAPFDAKSDYVNLDNSRLISYQDIFKWISNTNALHIVLILDCCHAGRIMNAKRSSPDRFEKIENFYQKIAHDPSVFGLIHSDLHFENVIENGEDLLPIDFDEVAYGHYLLDIAITFNEIEELPNVLYLKKNYCIGYEKYRPLPTDFEAIVLKFQQIAGCIYLNWFLAEGNEALLLDKKLMRYAQSSLQKVLDI